MHTLLIQFVFTILSITPTAQAGSNWCVGRPVLLKKDQLDCLKAAGQTLTVRKILSDAANGKMKSPPLNTNGVITKKKFLELFKRPIFVFSISVTRDGYYHVNFVFKDFPQHTFFVWLTINDDYSYEPEIIVDDGTTEVPEKIRKRLQQKEFLSYWL